MVCVGLGWMLERNRTITVEKRIVGRRVARLVKAGDVVGIGTGSTIACAIEELGRMVNDGLGISCVPTSYQSRFLAIKYGIPLTTLDENPRLEIAIDGADQVDSRCNAIKGGGAAHTLEKIVASSSERFVIAVDEEKLTERLDHFVPIEVIPQALSIAAREVKSLGGKPTLRMALMKDGPVITDNGNFILDVDFDAIESPARLSGELSSCVGVVEHGIFTGVGEVYVGRKGGSVDLLKGD